VSDSEPRGLLHKLEPLCAFPVRWPKVTLAILFLLGCSLGTGVFKLRFDPSAEKVFPEGHEAVENYQAFREAFGADESVFVAFELPEGQSVFDKDALVLGHEIARGAERLKGVDRTISLSDIPVLEVTPFGPRLTPGLPENPFDATPADLARFKDAVGRTPLVDRILISKDERSASVMIRLERLPEGVEGARLNGEIVERIQGLVEAERRSRSDVTFFVAGAPLIKKRIMDAIERDLFLFAPPLMLIALVVTFLVLRSVRSVVLVLLVLALSVELTLGAMGHMGLPLDPMTTLVPTLILVIGVADSLHLLVEQRTQSANLGQSATGANTVEAAAKHVFVPCLLTSLTTALGFGSLVTSSIPPIARFGAAAAMAAIVAFVVSMVLLPAAGALLPAPKPARAVRGRAQALGHAVLRRPGLSLALALLFCCVLGAGWAKVEADTDFLTFFPEDDPLVSSARAIQERFVGVAPCEIVVAGPPGCARDPKVLAAVLELERQIETLDLVDLSFSAADVLAKAQGLVTNKPDHLPETAAEVEKLAKLLMQVAGRELPLEQMISFPNESHPKEEWIRISVRAKARGSKHYTVLVNEVREFEGKVLQPLGLKARPTGTSVVFSESAKAIVAGQVESFLFAYALITLVLSVFLRSLRLGIVSAIPNVAPIVCMLGAMGYLGIPFNSFNSMVVTIALGIAVDDTIHMLAGFQHAARSLPLREAVQEVISREGTALISTSIVLFAGFCVLLLGSFGPTREFGLLTALAIGVALLSDLVILPAILVLFPWTHGMGAAEPSE
jgi:hydrophobe/amphiphile efflux-3 (HAE3) family protein